MVHATMKPDRSDYLHRPDRYVINKPSQERRAEKPFSKPFVFRYTNPAQQVFVVGSFNQWSPEANPMERLVDGAWQTVIELPRGHHQYCFLVDGVRTLDPKGSTEADGQGGKCNFLHVS